MFINFTNHASADWAPDQRTAAEQYGPIVDYPFPKVPPQSGTEDVALLGRTLAEKLLQMHPKAVLCQGEFTLAFCVATHLTKAGVPVLAAVTRRDCTERLLSDGSTVKNTVFRFCGFRPYPR